MVTSKKRTALALTGILLLSLAGCAGRGGNAGEGGNSELDGTGSEVVNENPSSADNNAEGNNVSGERPTLTMWSNWTCSDQVSDPGDTYFYQAIEEACNVNLEFINSTGGKEGLSILMGTGDLPDIVYEWDYNIPGGLQKALTDGSVLALNSLMDQGYMPNFKAYLESDPEVDKNCKNDNGQYVWVPMIRLPDSPVVFNGNLVRQDWLDELGLPVPGTLDEVETVLRAFKDQKGCEAPLSFAYSDYSSYVMTFGVFEGFYVAADNTVKYGFTQPEYKEFLTTFNRWYTEGLIDPDAFSQDIDAFYAKLATEKTGLVYGFTGSTLGQIALMKSENPEMDFQPIPYPTKKEGENFLFDISALRVNNVGMLISAKCKNPEAAARVLDYVYGEEGHMLANFGQEGVSYTIENGEPVFTELITNNPNGLNIQDALSFYTGAINKPCLIDNRYMMQTFSHQVQKDSLKIWETPGAIIKKVPTTVTIPDSELEEYNQIMTEVKTYVDEMKLKFIMGTESLDHFGSFVSNIEKMNIGRAAEIQQDAYERYSNR